MAADGEMEQLIDQIMQRMEQQDYIRIDEPTEPSRMSNHSGLGCGGRDPSAL